MVGFGSGNKNFKRLSQWYQKVPSFDLG